MANRYLPAAANSVRFPLVYSPEALLSVNKPAGRFSPLAINPFKFLRPQIYFKELL